MPENVADYLSDDGMPELLAAKSNLGFSKFVFRPRKKGPQIALDEDEDENEDENEDEDGPEPVDGDEEEDDAPPEDGPNPPPEDGPEAPPEDDHPASIEDLVSQGPHALQGEGGGDTGEPVSQDTTPSPHPLPSGQFQIEGSIQVKAS
ncbi:unnamed protein product [Calypogeia fissa]